ncbi:MAG: ATP-binding protein [Cyanobacteriota bacterium]
MSNNDKVLGLIKGPGENPNEYALVTTNNNLSKIGEFVYYETNKGHIIGRITDKKLIKGLPENFMADPEVTAREISSLIGLTTANFELFEVTVNVNGYFDEHLNCFINPRISPEPGHQVFLVSNSDLTKIINSKKEATVGSATIGSLLTREKNKVPVILNVKNLVSTHLAILASTGSGKSYTAGVLLEELLKPYNRASVLVVDPHNEYDTLQDIIGNPYFETNDYKPEVKIFSPGKINVRISSLTEYDIKYLLPNLSEKMSYYLSVAYKNVSKGKDPDEDSSYLWGLSDLKKELEFLREDNPEAEGTIEALLWRLSSRIGNSKIFSDNKHLPLNELFKPGRCSVLQLSEIDQVEQQIIVSTILRRINKARMDTHKGNNLDPSSESYIPYPVFALLEEAHRFAPANAPSVSENILKTILSEGRKFGVGIGLITQRPGKLNSDVLSQCMTQMIMKIINPIDQNSIASSVESAGSELLKELTSLTKGQVIIAGSAINTPVLCMVRERISAHGGETIDAPECWMNYFNPQNLENRKLEKSVRIRKDKSEKVEGLSI